MARRSRPRFVDVEYLLSRRGSCTGPHFDPSMNAEGDVTEFLATSPVLCVGAGGLGCEILKDLGLTGFKNVHVIDMDTIDVTNLNRQFLFGPEDVGRSKAEVAAANIMKRIDGIQVTPHFCKIQDMDSSFYEQFVVIVLGLDSMEARRYMNDVVCSMLEFNADGSAKPETIKPMIDGGTEGFKGHARVILPSMTPCFECTLWLFPPQTKFPLCTLAETPRSHAHCIEYAHLILWGKHHSEEFDSDNESHMQWVYEQALVRAKEYNISGVTLQSTQGVVKNIIPAIPSTNAIVAAACAFEAFKLVSAGSFANMENYMMYTGMDSVYTHTVKYERDESCPLCGAGVPVQVQPNMTVQQLLDALGTHPELGSRLSAPSVSVGGLVLYMRGPLESMYRGNLEKQLNELLPVPLDDDNDCCICLITDPKEKGAIKARLIKNGDAMQS